LGCLSLMKSGHLEQKDELGCKYWSKNEQTVSVGRCCLN